MYQGVPYLGIGRVRPFIKRTNKIFDYSGPVWRNQLVIPYVLKRAFVKGIEAQVEIFGEGMREFTSPGLRSLVTLICVLLVIVLVIITLELALLGAT